jgi:hypothetical protein
MAYQKLQAGRASAVTPSNNDILPPNGGQEVGCVLYVGTGGDLDVQTVGGDDVTFTGVPSGTFFPVQVRKVYATSVASDIIALW